MKARLMLAGLVIFVAGIGTASGDEPKIGPDATLREYTDYLIRTYGEDATVTEATVTGKIKSGEEFEDAVSSAPQPIKTEALVWWPGTAACTVYHSVVRGSLAWRFCRNHTISGLEMQRDHMAFFGSWKRQYSDLLDCQNANDMAGPPPLPPAPQRAKDQYCP